MKNFKYFTLAILSVFFISETLQAQHKPKPRLPVPAPVEKPDTPLSRERVGNWRALPTSTPQKPTDSARNSLRDMSFANLEFTTTLLRQTDNVIQYLENDLSITRQELREALRRGYNTNDHPLLGYFIRIELVSAIAYSSMDYLDNPLLMELMKRSLRWAINENTTDDIKNEINEMIANLERQGMTTEQRALLLTRTQDTYHLILTNIDQTLSPKTPGVMKTSVKNITLTTELTILNPEDIRVARLIREVLEEISPSQIQ